MLECAVTSRLSLYPQVTVNHLLGNTDKLVKDTVGIVDLGGGSVQMAYAVEEPVARSAPAGYIREVNGKGVRWNVYVHR